jgi:nucleoside-diphosphate-sugar epimerase
VGISIDIPQLNAEIKVLVTGASGWLGKETICYFMKSFNNSLPPNLIFSGKTTRRIKVHDQTIQIQALHEISKAERFDVIIHFAFVTQEKLSLMGTQQYIDENLLLNERIQEIASKSSSGKKLILSSGAAQVYGDSRFTGTSKEIYASLKLDLEERFKDSNSVVLRLWTTSGHHLGYNRNYAISDFIYLALSGEDILIRENVSRTYVAAQNVIPAALRFLLDNGSGIINSGGTQTVLSDLAQKIVEKTNSQSKVFSPSFDATHPGNYESPNSEIPIDYWLENKSLDDQISECLKGMQK